MGYERKLADWQDAGLIDGETAARIKAHEDAHSSPLVLYAVGSVGAIAIVLGLIAIVAANWGEISSQVKLSIDLLVGVVLAFALYRSRPGWAREVLLIVDYGFVLGSIGLIGQIYHLESAPWRPLVAWSIATFPMMLMTEKRFAATLWLVGLTCTHAAALFGFVDWLADVDGVSDVVETNWILSLIALSPLGYLLFARPAWIVRERPVVAGVFWVGGWLGISALALAGASLFYGPIQADDIPRIGVLFALVCWTGFAALLPRLDSRLSQRALPGMRTLLVGGALVAVLALSAGRGEWPLVGALFQILLLGGMAWTSLQAGYELGFRLGTAAVCMRLLIVYVEVFGSLLQTGLGLILGGALAMLLCWWWWRRSGQLGEALGPRIESPSSLSSEVES